MPRKSGYDEHGAGHAAERVWLAIIGECSGVRHRERLGCAHIRDGNEGACRIGNFHAAADNAALVRVGNEVSVEHDVCSRFHFNALGRVREIAVGEGNGRWGHDREVLCRFDIATIDVGDAGAGITHAACAFRVVHTRRTIATWTAAAAIDAGLRAILHHIATGRRCADHGIAIPAGAVAIDVANLAIYATVAHRAAAVDVGFRAILRHIRARRRRARHHRIAIRARAIRIVSASLTVHTCDTHRTAAIDVGFVAILHHVHTRRSRTLHHRIAIRAHAIAVAHAALTVHAIGHARTAAIRIGFAAIFEAVITRRRRADVRHRIAESALTIAVDFATFAVRAIVWTRAAAIDVGFRAVFLRIRAARSGARHSRTNLADAVGALTAHFAIDARPA